MNLPIGSAAPADDAARWASVEALLQGALACAEAERSAWLDAQCATPDLRREVEELVAAHQAAGVVDRLQDQVMRAVLPPQVAPGEPQPDLPPQAPYRIVERLGGGGMGVVYRAHDERLSRDVALKFLPPHLSADAVAKARFLVEARAAAAIEHPNICTVHEIGDMPDGSLFIVMACYEGETLDARIGRGPLPVAEALRVAIEIARGLSRAHERGIVHRDIKPANVMLTSDGQVKILDFGIAKLADITVTQTAGVIGTVAYMSPEQAFGETVDHRSDIWSLGVVLYEMLTGERPFQGKGDRAVLVASLSADPPPFESHRPDVPAPVEAIVRRALAKRAAERYANAGEMVAALGASLTAHGATAPGHAPPAPRESALARAGERRQVAVLAGVLRGHEVLVEGLSAGAAELVLARIREAVGAEAGRCGGLITEAGPEGFQVVFGVPVAHEEDALRAVRSALAIQERFSVIADSLDPRVREHLQLRCGVHVGAVVAQRGDDRARPYHISGSAGELAAHLAAHANAGAILVTPEARRPVAPFVELVDSEAVVLPGGGGALRPSVVASATSARSRLEGMNRERLTPLVGREREGMVLDEHLDSVRLGGGRLTVLVGEAGAGKSRLLHELRCRAAEGGLQVVLGRCDPYGRRTPFLPFIEAVQDALGVPGDASAPERHEAVVAGARALDASLEEYLPLYLALLAIPSSSHPVPEHLRGELFQPAVLEAIAALFTLSASRAPLVLLLEDWHWADDASRAALRQLGEIVPAFPLLIVTTSRPDTTIDWGTGDHQVLLHLAALDARATGAIAGSVLGGAAVDPELLVQLHERTGGNPFFVEELCQALREEGAVAVRRGTVVMAGEAAALHVPETVQGVLRTRIDRLDAEARDLVRIAAVIGREFSRGVLDEVAGSDASILPALDRLKGSGLVQQVGVVPEPAYRFKHALTQEVAYDSLLDGQRVTLHAAVGRAIERRYAARLEEHVERLAHHFSAAEEWGTAVRYGLGAAERAVGLSQYAEALRTLEGVAGWVERLAEGDQRRDLHADLLLRQERVCEMLGLRHRQLDLVEQLIALLAPHGPSERLAQVYLRRGDACTLLQRFEAAERALETALQIAGERGDAAGERNALRSLALLRSHEARHDDAKRLIGRVLELGRQAGDLRAEAGDLATLANILRAMGEPGEALRVLEEALTRTVAADNPVRYGALLNVIGTVHRDLGHYDLALEYFRRVTGEGLERRHPVNASFTLPAIAHIQLQQGQVEQALATYREAVELNQKARYADGSAHATRSLGEVLAALGRHVEALPYLSAAAALFGQLEDRRSAALMWRRIAASHERLEDFAGARAAWLQVREMAAGLGDLGLEAEAVEGVARAERSLPEEAGAAIGRYQEALALAARIGDRDRELAVRNALGIVHWRHGNYSEAMEQFEAGLRLCRERGDRVHEGLMLNSLAATLQRLQRWDEARATLAEALRVADQAGEGLLRAHALALLGDVCLASGRLDEAHLQYHRSLALRRDLEDRRGEAWMLERLGRLHAIQGRAEESREAVAAAHDVARDIPDEALHAALALQAAAADAVPFPQP